MFKTTIGALSLLCLALVGYIINASNNDRMRAEDKLIDLWMVKMTDDAVAGIEVLFDYCKIQPMPTLGKAMARYKTTHGSSLEDAKFKAREELIRNPFLGQIKNMCPLFQEQMDAMQRKLMTAQR
jgi:hypothetical protein